MHAKRIAGLAGGLALLMLPATSSAGDRDNECRYRYGYRYGGYSPIGYYGGFYPGRYYGYGARVYGAPSIYRSGYGIGYPRYGYPRYGYSRYGYRYGRFYDPGPRIGIRVGFGGYPGYYRRPYRYAGYGYPGYWGSGHRRAYYPVAGHRRYHHRYHRWHDRD